MNTVVINVFHRYSIKLRSQLFVGHLISSILWSVNKIKCFPYYSQKKSREVVRCLLVASLFAEAIRRTAVIKPISNLFRAADVWSRNENTLPLHWF